MDFKLGLGPMSSLIVNTLANFAVTKEKPLMVIASRNQVDVNSGYVMKTAELANHIQKFSSPFIKLCRDHCGPYFLDNERGLSLKNALLATKRTIAADIENRFQLIHIDTSRCDREYEVADELIQFCLSLNPEIEFEFGTEENIGVAAGLQKYQRDVKFAKQYPNMRFVVAQTGSLTMEDRQIGSFDINLVKQLSTFADNSGVKLKEHNADYLTDEQIKMRKIAGVHALNIAPQLGVVKTKTIMQLAKTYKIPTDDWKNIVLQSKKWQKWFINGDDNLKFVIAGHYCYSSAEFQTLLDALEKHIDWRLQVDLAITKVLESYYDNLY